MATSSHADAMTSDNNMNAKVRLNVCSMFIIYTIFLYLLGYLFSLFKFKCNCKLSYGIDKRPNQV